MPAPRCARVERKESFPYGARLDRRTYWRLLQRGEWIIATDEPLPPGYGRTSCGGMIFDGEGPQATMYRRRVRRE